MFLDMQIAKPGHLALAMLLTALSAHAQAPPQATGPTSDEGSRMVTPAPVNGEGYSLEFASETPRTNYISGGLNFSSAYDDGVTFNGTAPVSDVTYSIWPTIALNQSRSHLNWDLFYSPGFTFYQKNTSLNQTDQAAGLSLRYRFSPHVTLQVHDDFRKTSNLLGESGQNPANSNIGGLNSATIVVAPVTDQIINQGNVGITYQFAANGMVGITGFSSIWQFPNLAPDTGLLNSNTRGGEAFYTYRIAGRHYLGITYRYQDFRTTPDGSDTQSHSAFLFYSVLLKPRISLSLFGGPEYSDTNTGTPPTFSQWSPAGGGSFGWQGSTTSVAASVRKSISSGNGLAGATNSSSGDLSLRKQLTRNLTAGLGANYSDNKTLQGVVSSAVSGHTLGGTASMDLALQEHLSVGIGYTRFHQSYANILAIANTPDRDRVYISLSYQFRRPIGR